MSTHFALLAASLMFVSGTHLPQSSSTVGTAEPPILVIVSAATPGSEIPLGTLRNAFEGYPTDFNGKRLVPFNHPTGTPTRARFDKVLLGLVPNQVGQFWVDQLVRGGRQAPRTLPSSELALRVVASVPGSISYVAMVPNALPPALKILAIDGKRPTDSHYALGPQH